MSKIDAKKVVYLQQIYKELEILVKNLTTEENSTTTWGSISGTQSDVNVSGFANDAGYITSYNETDPIFTASPAATITAANITEWGTAIQPADNVSTLTNDAGYLTSFLETDPTVPAHVKSITTTNISTWNSAIQTGDNVSVLVNDAGYLTSFTETDPTVPSHVKSITTANITTWNSAVQPADLGTAATADSTDFATAAQGALADTSVQPNDNVSSLTNDAGYLTATTGYTGAYDPATQTLTIENGLITGVTPI